MLYVPFEFEQQDLERKHEMTLEAQKEIARANCESDEQRVRRQEQEKMADLKVTEYMKKKAQREAEFEAEQERIRLEKEKEIAKLRAMQVWWGRSWKLLLAEIQWTMLWRSLW